MTILLVATLLIFGGCSDKSKVKVVDEAIAGNVKIIKESSRILPPDGLMEVMILGENKSDGYLKLQYRIIWFDKEGFQIDTMLSKWIDFPVYENQTFTIKATAPNARASDYQLFIR